MTSKLKTDVLETVSGSGTIALTNQLSGMTSASMPSGVLLQTTGATNIHTNNIATASNSYEESGLVTGSITPLSAGSSFVVTFNGFIPHHNGDAGNRGVRWKVYRSVNGGAYAAHDSSALDGGVFTEGMANASWLDLNGSCQIFDTPTYTLGNVINYKIYIAKVVSQSGTAHFNHSSGVLSAGSITSTSIIQEIKG